jgi:hypothetical protein
MWIAYSNNGTKVESECGDWCCMLKIIEDYKETGMTEDEAYDRFWNDVKEFDEEEYNLIISKYGNFNDALGDGSFDELRNDYLFFKGCFDLITEIP